MKKHLINGSNLIIFFFLKLPMYLQYMYLAPNSSDQNTIHKYIGSLFLDPVPEQMISLYQIHLFSFLDKLGYLTFITAGNTTSVIPNKAAVADTTIAQKYQHKQGWSHYSKESEIRSGIIKSFGQCKCRTAIFYIFARRVLGAQRACYSCLPPV